MSNNQQRGDKTLYDTTERIIENNQVHLRGKMVTGFSFSHELLGEGFYTAQVTVDRLSEMTDTIPIMVSERLIDVTQDYIGKYVELRGQFRSYNQYNEEHNRLILHVFATKMEILEEEDYPINKIYLDGYICKPTVYRKTPLGREISDVLLAVNRSYHKSDYIPCICWGRNARYASSLEVSSHLQMEGRIQRREYSKRISETETESRTAYEVSVGSMKLLEE